MKLRISIYPFIIAIMTISGYSIAQDAGDNVLFTVDGNPVYSDEFSYIYKKNNSNSEEAFTKNDIDEYLDMAIENLSFVIRSFACY